MFDFRSLLPTREVVRAVPAGKRGGLNWALLAAAALLSLALVVLMPSSPAEAACQQPNNGCPEPSNRIVGLPSNIQVVVNAQGTGAQVTWKEGTTDGRGNTADCVISYYDVQLRKSRNGWFTLQSQTRSSTTSHTLTGLTPGTSYRVTVVAWSTPCQRWDANSVTFTVPPADPPTPEPTQVAPKEPSRGVRYLAIEGDSDGTATVTWSKPRRAAARCTPSEQYRYKVVLWTGAVGDRIDREEVVEHTMIRARTVELTGLTSGTAYGVLVWAYSDECENWSPFRRAIWTQP